jgi:hypothetical protein
MPVRTQAASASWSASGLQSPASAPSVRTSPHVDQRDLVELEERCGSPDLLGKADNRASGVEEQEPGRQLAGESGQGRAGGRDGRGRRPDLDNIAGQLVQAGEVGPGARTGECRPGNLPARVVPRSRTAGPRHDRRGAVSRR